MSVEDTIECEQIQENSSEFDKRYRIFFRGKEFTHTELHKKILRRPRLFLVILGNIAIITLVMILIMLFTFMFNLIVFE